MAEKAQRVVQVSPDAHAAQEIAEGLAAFEAAGVGRHNNITVAGGVFGNARGNGFHDSEGNPVTKDGKPIAGEAESEDDTPAKPARKR